MMTLKRPPPLCSSKSHQYDNYDKALYIVCSYHYSHKANLKAVLTCAPGLTNSPTSPSTHQERYFKVYLLQESDLELGKSKRALQSWHQWTGQYSRYYKRKQALHEIPNTWRHSMLTVFFKCNSLFVLLTLQIISQGQAEHDKLLKPLNY